MFTGSVTTILALASVATAHFTLLAPEPRGNSFRAPASQWIYPCAGINTTEGVSNRTLWPISGGAVAFNQTHESAISYINLGLGVGQPNFNISLLEHGLLNVTQGVLCLPDLSVPAGTNITEGTQASIQVITLAHGGAALYNCADITFSAKAPVVDSAVCKNSSSITAEYIGAADHSKTVASNATNTTAGEKPKSAAAGGFGGSSISTVVVGFSAVLMSYIL